ncbi:MAG: 5'/3'-nucleotidase SurE [Anaerolineales bacterium]
MQKPQILLANDDGIRSPGLWAAAGALARIGFVTVVAPREQCSGMGRSLPNTSDGIIEEQRVQVNGQEWSVYAVGGSPAQAVLHGILEVMPAPPDLVVSGINYGENMGTGVTISGTVGAAMEAAAMGYPALAVSLETDQEHHLSYSQAVDFSAAAHFTLEFARQLLTKSFPPDVDLLNINVPSDATPQTEWRLTPLSKDRYYDPTPPERDSWAQPGAVGYREAAHRGKEKPGTDIAVVHKERLVSVTPLSLDLTSRDSFAEIERILRK